jgi:hypothetical protein
METFIVIMYNKYSWYRLDWSLVGQPRHSSYNFVLCVVAFTFGIYSFNHITFSLKKPVVVAYGWIAFFNVFLAEGALNICFQQFPCAGNESLGGETVVSAVCNLGARWK